MNISSEYVSLGHPDRLCDTIAANLINRIQKKDKEASHAAVEVFASDDTVVFGGEITTSLVIDDNLLRDILKQSFHDCGYIDERRSVFSKSEVYLFEDTKIINKIHAQSADIARATTDKKEASGFNDQGIFFGAYDSLTPTGQGVAKYLSQSFGEWLFAISKKRNDIGSDIKIVFTLNVDEDCYTPKSIEHVTVAIPTSEATQATVHEFVKAAYKDWQSDLNSKLSDEFCAVKSLLASNPSFTINGTGRYVNHGYHSDASMTGRKLAVNNMSAGPVYSQCQCGGGSYIKPFHASDLLLPMIGNWIAGAVVKAGLTKYANVALACTIGSTKVDSICITGDKAFDANIEQRKKIEDFLTNLDLSPNGIITRWKFFDKDFYEIEKQNFVGEQCPWDDVKELSAQIKKAL